ncbi:MAG: hypothetical protein WDZ80_07640 [Candidatus Paceibacterota bacterium]
MSLSKQERGDIAEKLVRKILQDKGLSSLKPNDLRRELGNIAKKIDVETDKLIEFVQPIYEELLKEAFKNSREES